MIQAVTSSVWPRKEIMQHVQAIYKKVSARVAAAVAAAAAAEAAEAAGFVGVRPTVAADGIGRLGGMDVGQLVHDHFVQQCGTQARAAWACDADQRSIDMDCDIDREIDRSIDRQIDEKIER